MTESALNYRLADVFAERPYEGNGVAIFVDQTRLSSEALQAVTVEIRQFESAFLWSTSDPHIFETRIFVVDQELAFAGHPALGAAAVLDVSALEGRNWVNDGSVEDIATGSAAGPAAAYLVRHGEAASSTPIEISQGRFVGRPSSMTVVVTEENGAITSVRLSGQVCMAGSGVLDGPPST